MKKHLFLSLCLLLMAVLLHAHQLTMQSFQHRPTDLTANTPGTIVNDQNGRKCALIKVETTLTSLTFEAGMLGVRKAEQHPGEWWVYVPDGVKCLSIFHPREGVLRDQDLGLSVRAGNTYLMKISAQRPGPVADDLPTAQWVVFQLQPANAVVELDGEMLPTEDGVAQKYLRFGQYDYRVKAPDYLTETGKVTVNDPEQKHVLQVKLRPNIVEVSISVDGQAEIWVNGQKKGTGQWTGQLGGGTYLLEARLPGHRNSSVTRDIDVTQGRQDIRLQAPTPIYGRVNVSSTPGLADIYIDGQKVGQTPQLLSRLLIGQHQLRITRQGYQDYTSTLTVREGVTEEHTATLSKVAAATPAGGGGSTAGGDRQTFTVGGVSFQMVRVEGQGSTFYIGETEVTQALWEAVMGSNPSFYKGSNRPVECVSWDDCKKFISKLNSMTGRKFRLPKEAEWEFAAKGGNKSRGYEYSGCNTENELEQYAWYDKNAYYCGSSKRNSSHPDYGTHDVKTKRPNELGLYDMSGNVWEWCEDLYDTWGTGRMNRGGSWYGRPWGCRVTFRSWNDLGIRLSYLGLRLAL